MKAELLALLREKKEYISGQELCNHFGVSRTAIWKVINQLKAEGYEIEAVQNKGYLLKAIPNCLSKEEIVSRIHTKWAGKEVIFQSETESTNGDCKKLAENGGAHGTLVVADSQTGGRGRRGRKWESEKGTSISMSLLLRPSIFPDQAPVLTLIMALSVVQAMEEIGIKGAGIKWPNDIVINGKKVCGILTEMSAEIGFIHYVVIGVGVNVSTKDFPEELEEVATSIYLQTGTEYARAQLIEAIVRIFEEHYEYYVKHGSLGQLKDSYETFLVNANNMVRVLDAKGEYSGTALGINESGELLVKKDSGEVCPVYAGEVSVRGYLGYV